jgi:hypothetical protein
VLIEDYSLHVLDLVALLKNGTGACRKTLVHIKEMFITNGKQDDIASGD